MSVQILRGNNAWRWSGLVAFAAAFRQNLDSPSGSSDQRAIVVGSVPRRCIRKSAGRLWLSRWPASPGTSSSSWMGSHSRWFEACAPQSRTSEWQLRRPRAAGPWDNVKLRRCAHSPCPGECAHISIMAVRRILEALRRRNCRGGSKGTYFSFR